MKKILFSFLVALLSIGVANAAFISANNTTYTGGGGIVEGSSNGGSVSFSHSNFVGPFTDIWEITSVPSSGFVINSNTLGTSDLSAKYDIGNGWEDFTIISDILGFFKLVFATFSDVDIVLLSFSGGLNGISTSATYQATIDVSPVIVASTIPEPGIVELIFIGFLFLFRNKNKKTNEAILA